MNIQDSNETVCAIYTKLYNLFTHDISFKFSEFYVWSTHDYKYSTLKIFFHLDTLAYLNLLAQWILQEFFL